MWILFYKIAGLSLLIPFNPLRGGLNSSALKLGNGSLGVEGKSGPEDLNHVL